MLKGDGRGRGLIFFLLSWDHKLFHFGFFLFCCLYFFVSFFFSLDFLKAFPPLISILPFFFRNPHFFPFSYSSSYSMFLIFFLSCFLVLPLLFFVYLYLFIFLFLFFFNLWEYIFFYSSILFLNFVRGIEWIIVNKYKEAKRENFIL